MRRDSAKVIRATTENETMETVTVDIRKAGLEPGFLLSVTRGNITWPGPRCSSRKTAREVATWICHNLPRANA